MGKRSVRVHFPAHCHCFLPARVSNKIHEFDRDLISVGSTHLARDRNTMWGAISRRAGAQPRAAFGRALARVSQPTFVGRTSVRLDIVRLCSVPSHHQAAFLRSRLFSSSSQQMLCFTCICCLHLCCLPAASLHPSSSISIVVPQSSPTTLASATLSRCGCGCHVYPLSLSMSSCAALSLCYPAKHTATTLFPNVILLLESIA